MTQAHVATGNPRTVASVGDMAREIVETKTMPHEGGFTLAAVHILSMELSAALTRISTLEKRLAAQGL